MYQLKFLPIIYTDTFLEHKITAGISDVGVNFCPIQDPQVINAEAGENDTIILEFDMPLMEGAGQENAFIVTDDYSYSFYVLSTELGETPYFLMLHMESLIGAISYLNVAFRPIQDQVQMGMLRTQMTPNCIKQLTDFDIQAELQPPEGYSDHNIQAGITDVLVDFQGSNISRSIPARHTQYQQGITDVSVTFIHIDDINP